MRRAITAFHRAHHAFEGPEEETEDICKAYNRAIRDVQQAPCHSHQDVIEKLRVYELCFLEYGGDYVDGRELAWMGTLKADLLRLSSSHTKRPQTTVQQPARPPEDTPSIKAFNRLMTYLNGLKRGYARHKDVLTQDEAAEDLRHFQKEEVEKVIAQLKDGAFEGAE